LIAQPLGDLEIIAKILANLGELDLDLSTIQEAIHLLQRSENHAALKEIKKIYADVEAQLKRSTLVQG
jgi:hypothetical protein